MHIGRPAERVALTVKDGLWCQALDLKSARRQTAVSSAIPTATGPLGGDDRGVRLRGFVLLAQTLLQGHQKG